MLIKIHNPIDISFHKCIDGELDAVTTGTDGHSYGFRS